MTTFEDLYYGNISPHERYIKRGTRVDKLVSLDKCFKISFVTALKGGDKIVVQIIEPHIAFIGLGKGRCEFDFFFAKILYAQNLVVNFPKLKSARPNRRKINSPASIIPKKK